MHNLLDKLGCDILSFFDHDRVHLVDKERDVLSYLYMLQNMSIHSILYKDMTISVGDVVTSYSGHITHKVREFRIGLHGNMNYFADDDAPKHEMSITNIIKKG